MSKESSRITNKIDLNKQIDNIENNSINPLINNKLDDDKLEDVYKNFKASNLKSRKTTNQSKANRVIYFNYSSDNVASRKESNYSIELNENILIKQKNESFSTANNRANNVTFGLNKSLCESIIVTSKKSRESNNRRNFNQDLISSKQIMRLAQTSFDPLSEANNNFDLNQSNYYKKESLLNLVSDDFVYPRRSNKLSTAKRKQFSDYAKNSNKSLFIVEKKSRRNSSSLSAGDMKDNHQSTKLNSKKKSIDFQKIADITIGILSLVNIIVSIFTAEFSFDELELVVKNQMNQVNAQYFSDREISVIHDRIVSTKENILRILCIILTTSMLLLQTLKYKHKVNDMIKDKSLSKFDNLFSSGLYKKYALECLVILPCYPPYLNYIISGELLAYYFVYDLNSIIVLLSFFKFYFVFKIYNYYSQWTSLTARAVCNKHKVNQGLVFAIKTNIKVKPYIFLILSGLFILLLLTIAIRIAEFGMKKVNSESSFIGDNPLQLFSKCIWLIIISMTTVGYGDEVPVSTLGRVIGVLSCLIGMILISLLVFTFAIIIEFNQEEKDVYMTIKKKEADIKVITKAAYVIKNILFIKQKLKNNNCSFQSQSKSIDISSQSLVSRSSCIDESRLKYYCYSYIYLRLICFHVNSFKYYNKLSRVVLVPIKELFDKIEDNFQHNFKHLTRILNGIENQTTDFVKLQIKADKNLNILQKIKDNQLLFAEYLVNYNNTQFNSSLVKCFNNHYKKRIHKSCSIESEIKLANSNVNYYCDNEVSNSYSSIEMSNANNN